MGAFTARHYRGKRIGLIYPAARIAVRTSYPLAAASLAAQAETLKAAGAQVVIAFVSPADRAKLTKAMTVLGYHPALIVTNTGGHLASG